MNIDLLRLSKIISMSKIIYKQAVLRNSKFVPIHRFLETVCHYHKVLSIECLQILPIFNHFLP